MRILIDNGKLELLLEKKRDFIGKKITLDTIIAGISFFISVWTASYDNVWTIPGVVLKTIFCLQGIVVFLLIIILFNSLLFFLSYYTIPKLLAQTSDIFIGFAILSILA